jgi:hypothetical protein
MSKQQMIDKLSFVDFNKLSNRNLFLILKIMKNKVIVEGFLGYMSLSKNKMLVIFRNSPIVQKKEHFSSKFLERFL